MILVERKGVLLGRERACFVRRFSYFARSSFYLENEKKMNHSLK